MSDCEPLDSLCTDREDLLAVLTLRFGGVPETVRARIAACVHQPTLERWILVAANAPRWETFLNELGARPDAFKIVGPLYDPTPMVAAPAPTAHPHPISPEEK